MASKGKVEKMKRNKALIERYAAKRAKYKAEGEWEKLAELPRNSSPHPLPAVLQADRPDAGDLPEVPDQPDHAAGHGPGRPDPRDDQGELVTQFAVSRSLEESG